VVLVYFVPSVKCRRRVFSLLVARWIGGRAGSEDWLFFLKKMAVSFCARSVEAEARAVFLEKASGLTCMASISASAGTMGLGLPDADTVATGDPSRALAAATC
jgi:hypothetical protein